MRPFQNNFFLGSLDSLVAITENLTFPRYYIHFLLAAKKLDRQGEHTAKFYFVSAVNFFIHSEINCEAVGVSGA